MTALKVARSVLLLLAAMPCAGCGPAGESSPEAKEAGAVRSALDLSYAARGLLLVTSAVRSGPSSAHAFQATDPDGATGEVLQGERVYVLEVEDGWSYIDHGAGAGRKRGYVESSRIAIVQQPYRRPVEELSSAERCQEPFRLTADTLVYAGPSAAAYVSIGKLPRNEPVTVLLPAAPDRHEYDWLFIDYGTPSGRRRGWIPN